MTKLLAIILLAVFLCACQKPAGQIQNEQMSNEETQEKSIANQENAATGQVYEQDKPSIEYFCEVMDVKKENLVLHYNYRENERIVNYDIEVKDDAGLNGTYMLLPDAAYKKVSDKEREKWNLMVSDGYDFDAIYYPVYEEGEAEDKSHFDKDAIVLDINTEKMADYDERLFGTYKLPDCSSGYINKSDNFSVNYIFGMNHITGSFVDGKWDIKKRNIEKDYSDYSCDSWIQGRDDTLWGIKYVGNYRKIIVFDQSGKILYRIDMKKWQRKNGYSKSKLNEVIPLSDEECILVFEEDGKEISCQLDLSTEAVIRKYETGLHGIPAGDYLCYLEGNRLNVYNYKNEGKKMSVNIENLWEGYIRRDLVYYNKSAMDFLGVCNPYSDATICTNDNKVYISLCTGVFEWTVGEDCIYKVLDGEKTKYFNKMNGIMQVGKNGVVYILGNFGWEDEDWDPSQFLVMTPVMN